MTCDEALELISGHIDQENTPEEEALLQAHLQTCAQCREVLQAFIDMEGGISCLEEPPADLRERVMEAIHAEAPAPKKKHAKRWGSLAIAAALVAVIGISTIGLPEKQAQQSAEAVPMMARVMPEPTAFAAEEAALELETTDSAVYSSVIDPQQLADERQADVAVTYELLPEMEVCTCETLESGAVLYLLETADGAVNLSRIYGVELYQAAIHSGSCSYALLLPQG